MSRFASLRRVRARSMTTVRSWILVESLESRQLLTTTVSLGTAQYAGLVATNAATSAPPSSALTPSQVQAAYGINKIAFSGGTIAGTGAGQTIAIVDFGGDSTIAADLAAFDKQFGLAPASLSVVNQAGGSTLPANDPTAAVETSLDVEWAHAVAPGAKILLVEANSGSYSDLVSAIGYAGSHANVVSMSFGGSEFSGESALDSTLFNKAGVTFVAASGDEGGLAGADWPASSPNVVAVGGTTLRINGTTGAVTETAWSGSTGGVSQYEPLPSYQSGTFGNYATGRTTPDVSYNANPNTGVAVYAGGTWYQVGGTSAGSPQWAALIAIADQGRQAVGEADLNSQATLSTLLYGNAASLYQATPSTDFRDITRGSSYVARATQGYDLVTGLGSPIANVLIPSASGQPASNGVTTPTTTAPTTTARRSATTLDVIATTPSPSSNASSTTGATASPSPSSSTTLPIAVASPVPGLVGGNSGAVSASIPTGVGVQASPLAPPVAQPVTTNLGLLPFESATGAMASEVARPTPGTSDRVQGSLLPSIAAATPRLRRSFDYAEPSSPVHPEAPANPQGQAAPAADPVAPPPPPPANPAPSPVPAPAPAPVPAPEPGQANPGEVASAALQVWDAALDEVAPGTPAAGLGSSVPRLEAGLAAAALVAWGGREFGIRRASRDRRRTIAIARPSVN